MKSNYSSDEDSTRVSQIDAVEARRRLVNICTGSDILFPSKLRDLHVILMAASAGFQRGMIYTESEVNESIRTWLDTGCPSLLIDEVTLRRELIDANYLMRDDAGRFYALGQGPGSITFTDDVANLDPVQVVNEATTEREARKREHLARKEDPSKR